MLLRTCVALFTLGLSVAIHAAQPHQCKDISLHVLGSGGPEINDGRASSSYLISHKDKAVVLLDVGSGSHMNFDQTGHRFNDLEAVLLSHLHTDHSADLPTYIKGSYFTNRYSNLAIIGPSGNNKIPSTTSFINRLFGTKGAFSYLSDYLEAGAETYQIEAANAHTSPASKALNTYHFPSFSATAVNVTHGPIPAVAWRVNLNGCHIGYLGDTSDDVSKLAKFVKNTDLLIAHNAIPNSAGRIAKHLHITPDSITNIVKLSQPRHVLLSHFMHRTVKQKDALQQALRTVFKGEVHIGEDSLELIFD